MESLVTSSVGDSGVVSGVLLVEEEREQRVETAV